MSNLLDSTGKPIRRNTFITPTWVKDATLRLMERQVANSEPVLYGPDDRPLPPSEREVVGNTVHVRFGTWRNNL